MDRYIRLCNTLIAAASLVSLVTAAGSCVVLHATAAVVADPRPADVYTQINVRAVRKLVIFGIRSMNL